MVVTRVHDDTGSSIEPPLDEAWDDLTQLRWHAAVVAHDTGLRVTVNPGGEQRKVGEEWVAVPGTYGISVGRTSAAAFNYAAAWTYLNGVSTGAREAVRDHPHRYLSTGCLHGQHAYCQGKTGRAGAKRPAECKFCAARCVCDCHQGGGEQP
jgi:hypothetical protein